MNINNQIEYKKPLGSRLFILITVCMIVVAMAVPAFAYEVQDSKMEYPEQFPPQPEQESGWPFFISFYDDQYKIWSLKPESITNGIAYDLQSKYFVDSVTGEQLTKTSRSLRDGAWYSASTGVAYFWQGIKSIVYSSFVIYDTDGNLLFPPPDLMGNVTDALPTVLSWIQQTLNALFVEGGALQGLLLLVAVPVAITLVFLGARFIRSVIWGA